MRIQGVQFFIETGFIPSSDPKDIARFLLETDGLSKAMIGEYLGEGSVLKPSAYPLTDYKAYQ